MSKKMWALSSGSYSDYRVKVLFASKKLAEEAVRADNADKESWGESFSEVFEVYDTVPEMVTVHVWQEAIYDDGTTSDFRASAHSHLPWNHYWDYAENGRPKVRFVRAPMYHNRGGRLEVSGTDEQAVKQAFTDNKARILAEAQGLI